MFRFQFRRFTRMLAIILTVAGSSVAAQPLNDAAILGIYSQVNSFDIETALLGALKGQSEEVRALGQMVSGDHTGVRTAVHDLAATLAITPVLPPERFGAARDHDAVVTALHAAEGADFDAAYLLHEIAFHRAAIAAVETALLPGVQSPDLKAHFEAVLPAFRHHLQATIEAADGLGVSYPD